MTGLDDHELLAEYARSESEAAFDALAARYVNLVYSAALRFTGNPHHAQEIAQAVFIILARKAKNFSSRKALSGWLYQTARLTAANFVKGEIRRQRREQEAYMQSTLNETGEAAWRQIAPLLDEAMGRLGETDRNAVVLRFFENKTAQEVGAKLNMNEAAAHKRVERALEKLRKFFTKRGVTFSAVAIAGAVSANSVQAAPVGLAKTISAVAIAKGSIAQVSILMLVKGTMKTITWMKFRSVMGIVTIALFFGGVATVAISQTGTHFSNGPQYEVEGTVSGFAYNYDGTPQPEPLESRVFDLCVSNGVWEMTLKLTDETKVFYRNKAKTTGRSFDMEDYDRITFDGTGSLYCFSDAETAIGKYEEMMRAAGTPIPPANDNRADAAVVGQEVPHSVEGDSEIWLAYASSRYFQNAATKFLEVTWRWGFPEIGGQLYPGKSIKRRATWELQQDAPHLPKSVTYFFGDAGNATNAHFAVQSWKTFQNLTLPEESTLDVYRFDQRTQPSTNTVLSIHYVVKATAFKKLEKGIVLPPPVPVLTAVTDHRFNSPTDPSPGVSVPYMIQDRFLTKEEARHSSDYATFKLNPNNPKAVPNPGAKKIRRFALISIGALALLSAIGLVQKLWHKRK